MHNIFILVVKLSMLFLAGEAAFNADAYEPVYIPLKTLCPTATTLTTTTTPSWPLNAHGIPQFAPLTREQTKLMINAARAGDRASINEIFTRIFWGALKNPFGLDDILRSPYILSTVLTHAGYIFWPTIIELDGVARIAGLQEKIIDYAETRESPQAHYAVGLMCAKGLLPYWRPASVAAQHWQKASDHNFAPAQTRLALAYLDGDGVGTDVDRGLKLLRAAANHDYLLARYYLGAGFFQGRGGIGRDDAIEMLLASQQPGSRHFLDKVFKVVDSSTPATSWSRESIVNELRENAQRIDSEFAKPYRQNLVATSCGEERVLRKKLVKSYKAWHSSMLSILDLLSNVKPGFLITNVDPISNAGSHVLIFSDSDEANYAVIGRDNVVAYRKYEEHLRHAKMMVNVMEKIETLKKKERAYDDKKIDRIKCELAIKEKFSWSAELTDVERQCLPMNMAMQSIDLRARQVLAEQKWAKLEEIKIWVQRVQSHDDLVFDKFIEDGADARNAEFIKFYPHLRH